MLAAGNYLWSVVPMGGLLCCSAFFSASETALFNISKRQAAKLAESSHKAKQMVAKLLKKPKKLMTTLLLGNMLVNVLYYALSGTMTIKTAEAYGHFAAVVLAAAAFFALIMFGEMLPKSMAYTKSAAVAAICAPAAAGCIWLFAPVRIMLNYLLVIPVIRLTVPAKKNHKSITAHQFKLLVESSKQKGLITQNEKRFISAIVELSVLKVRHIMRPRVDMLLCKGSADAEKTAETLREKKQKTAFVYSGNIDNITGQVNLKNLAGKKYTAAKKIAEEIKFVPEQKKVDEMLEDFLKQKYQTAVAVDEFGQVAGVISLDDIIDHLLGCNSQMQNIKAVEKIAPMKYRLAADVSIHHWADDFGIDYENVKFSTVAGLTTALLGKVPKQGDCAKLQNLKFTVEKVEKHRIKTIILSFEPFGENK